ncbi:MAG TPA: histidine kinase [Flavobacterium sp.]|nr:histidine kinase [Flavobacterium sp.]
MKPHYIKILLSLFCVLATQAQELLPFTENYSKSDYHGDNQIWNVVQGQDKAMYFANNHYFLRYDGVKWEKNTLPNRTIIRSVLAVHDRVYCGSYKEFGYWYRKDGRMHYVSISKDRKLFSDNGNEEIWKILLVGSKVYFQSFNEIYIYEQGAIAKIKLPFQISYCFEVGGELLFASIRDGIYKMQGKQFVRIDAWAGIANNVVHAIERHKQKTFIFTQKNGIFVADARLVSPWAHPLNALLKTSIINAARFINDHTLIVGTASKGVFSIDLRDGSYLNINRDNVLMNNSILSIGFDQENDLWLGLDNGIAHIEINSPIALFSDNSGVLGSVYSVAMTPGGYLLASNHGIFKYKDKNLSVFGGSQGQAWNISKMGGRFLVGHNEGTFLFDNASLGKINNVSGGWNLSKSNIDGKFLQATYSGVVVYDANDLSRYRQIRDFYKPIKYVTQNKRNEVWAADNYRGLYRVLYDEDFKAVKIENVSQQNKLTNDFGVKIFEFRNEVLFLIDHGWYTYNSITGQLEKNALFDANFKNITDIVAIDESNFLILQSGLLYLIQSVNQKFVWNFIQEKYYRGKIINDNLTVFREKDRYLLNLDDGFISLKLNEKPNELPAIKTEAYSQGSLIGNGDKIPYNTELELHVISGLYGSSKPTLFCRIDEAEIIPIKDGAIVLNNLGSGGHNAKIYYNDGMSFKEIKRYEFKVAKPWYFSFWMILVYLFVIAFIWLLYYRWNKIRYNQRLQLREEELRHQKKILEIELKAENELNIQEYEKHILELEIQSKSSEVAGKSLSIAKQSEMIENIQQILETESDINRLKSEIRKAIKINAVNKHEWQIFENNLNQIHNEFIVGLSKKYPNLTSKDIKLCVYLKMNLSSKEIAPLMNISFRGVELHRYRLRKKLGLSQDENLNKFMFSV